jgi:uncharacterized protein (TIGR02246 family)
MIALRIHLLTAAALSFYLTAGSGPAVAATAKKAAPPAAKAKAAPSQDEEGSIKAQLQALSKAVANADAGSMAALWTKDGVLVDEEGVETAGRAALEKRFADAFSDTRKQTIEMAPERIRVLADNVAASEGTVIRKAADGDAEPVTRYTMVFVKQAGTWLIANATETALVPQSHYDHLKELGWLVGEWSAEKDGATVRMKADWAPSKNFIQCQFETQSPGEPQLIDNQVIGWDPKEEQVVCWNFNSGGGFSYGSWTRAGRQWLINLSGVQEDGSTSKGVNVISKSDQNTFSWQTLKREIDGVAVGNTEPVKVQRVVR